MRGEQAGSEWCVRSTVVGRQGRVMCMMQCTPLLPPGPAAALPMLAIEPGWTLVSPRPDDDIAAATHQVST